LTAGRRRVAQSIRPAIVGAIALLAAELLYLTFRFDTQGLVRSDSVFALVLGWAPQYLRLATTTALLTIALAGDDLLLGLRSVAVPDGHRWRFAPLAVHATFLLAFIGLSASLFESDAAELSQLPLRTVAWFLAGAGTLVAWSLAVFPTSSWAAAARAARFKLAVGCDRGRGDLVGGIRHLNSSGARWPFYTFAVVEWTLRLIYPSDDQRYGAARRRHANIQGRDRAGVLGLRGYRTDCRLPERLPLAVPPRTAFPGGARAVANWRRDDLDRQRVPDRRAGCAWHIRMAGDRSRRLPFTGRLDRLQCDRARICRRHDARWLFQQARKERQGGRAAGHRDRRLSRTVRGDDRPTAMLTGALSAGFDWLYPLRVLVVAGVLWAFRKHYTEMKWSFSPISIAIGAVTFVMWLALLPVDASSKDLWPAASVDRAFLVVRDVARRCAASAMSWRFRSSKSSPSVDSWAGAC
jgi:hypothetical protein